jgi:hypothetical protein
MLWRQKILVVIAWVCSGACLSDGIKPPEVIGSVANPDAIKKVLSGKQKVANAAWWGFNDTDATDALQGAINSGAPTVIVPDMGKDWIVRPVHLASNQEIVFSAGVRVVAKSNLGAEGSGPFRDRGYAVGDCLFTARNKDNIVLRGYGATLMMRKSEYEREKKPGEGRHVIKLESCRNVHILGFTVRDSGGDGILVGRDYTNVRQKFSDNVFIKDVICDSCRRNAITVSSANNLTIENCVLKNTAGTQPQAGIDCEPARADSRLSDVRVRGTRVEGNAGYGLIVSLNGLKSSSPDIGIQFESIYVSGSKGIQIINLNDDGPQGIIQFKDVIVEKITSGSGAWIRKSSKSAMVRFTNCIWKDISAQVKRPLEISSHVRDKIKYPGGLEFVDCQVFDNQDRPAISTWNAIQQKGEGLYELRGHIYVKNDRRKGKLSDWRGANACNVELIVEPGVADFCAPFQ